MLNTGVIVGSSGAPKAETQALDSTKEIKSHISWAGGQFADVC